MTTRQTGTRLASIALLSKPAFWLLSLLHGALGDWAAAIVLLSVVVYPFRLLVGIPVRTYLRKHTQIGASIKPQLQAARQQWHRDPLRRQQAILDIYRTAQFNPLGGIVAALIAVVWQLPFALLTLSVYAALRTEPELARAGFWWVPALGEPDPRYWLPLALFAMELLRQLVRPAAKSKSQTQRLSRPASALIVVVVCAAFASICALLPAGIVLYVIIHRALSIVARRLI